MSQRQKLSQKSSSESNSDYEVLKAAEVIKLMDRELQKVHDVVNVS